VDVKGGDGCGRRRLDLVPGVDTGGVTRFSITDCGRLALPLHQLLHVEEEPRCSVFEDWDTVRREEVLPSSEAGEVGRSRGGAADLRQVDSELKRPGESERVTSLRTCHYKYAWKEETAPTCHPT